MWGSLRLSPIISNTHAPLLQLCIVTPNHIMIAMPLMVTITLYGATIQGCSGAWVLLITILAIVSCTGLYLSFYTCLTISFLYFLHLFNSVLSNVFWGGGRGWGELHNVHLSMQIDHVHNIKPVSHHSQFSNSLAPANLLPVYFLAQNCNKHCTLLYLEILSVFKPYSQPGLSSG